MDLSCDYLKMKHPIAQKALYALLEVKDSDLRLDTVYQGNHAVDQGIHILRTDSTDRAFLRRFHSCKCGRPHCS